MIGGHVGGRNDDAELVCRGKQEDNYYCHDHDNEDNMAVQRRHLLQLPHLLLLLLIGIPPLM